jgi:hypothetical protein
MANGIELAKQPKETLIEKLQRKTAQVANLTEKLYGTAALAQRTATLAGAGFLLGKIEANYTSSGTAVPTVAGLPWQAVWGAGMVFAGHFLGGRSGELVGDAGAAALVVAAYEAGKA